MTAYHVFEVTKPPGHWLFGHYFPFRDDTLAFFDGIAREYGRVVPLRFGPQRVLLINDAEMMDSVFRNPGLFAKAGRWERLKAMLGDGLLTGDGASWLRHRKMLAPAFHRRSLGGLVDMMGATTEEAVDRWRSEHGVAVFDINREMMSLALDIVVRALFQTSVRSDTDAIHGAFTELQKQLLRRMWSFNPWVGRFPRPRNRRFNKALGVLNEVVLKIISESRAQGIDSKNDLLGMMLGARDNAGAGMSDQQIRDEVMTLILAGHETTANALSWSWYLLGRHPEVLRKVRAELSTVLGGRAPTFADLSKLTYTGHVFDEVMRLFPPLWFLPRTAKCDTAIGGAMIPAGTMIIVLPWLLHHDAEYWDDPTAFNPDRFANPTHPRMAYIPFGTGPRTCLGKQFALMEAKVVLATILQRANIRLAHHREIEPQPLLSLRPRRGIPATLELLHS